jgi:AcrR family transcriptional regulator
MDEAGAVARSGPGATRARRAAALAAARAIAAEGGYEDVTMREIALRSGVSRATLYRYFSSKDELLTQVSLDVSASLREELEAHPSTAATAAERVTEVFARVLGALAREPKLLAALLRSYFANDPEVEVLAPEVRRFGGIFVDTGLAGSGVPNGAEIARVLGPISLAMAIRISSGHSTLDEAVEEIRCAVRLLLRA